MRSISIQPDDLSSESTQMAREFTGGEITERWPTGRPLWESRYARKTWSKVVSGRMVRNGQSRTSHTQKKF